jgi:three-Cys-motif partner protein
MPSPARVIAGQATRLDDQTSLFEDFTETDQLAKGSASIALEIEPAFTHYIFIEKDPRKFADLMRTTKEGFPDKVSKIQFVNKDANVALPELCRSISWKHNRAVLILDPYGMQVDGSTIAGVAETKAIDFWYLFPAFIGLGRMLPHTGTVPQEWESTLDRCLGDVHWREEFYQDSVAVDLFDEPRNIRQRKLNHESVERYFKRRLESAFGGVARRALPLYNSRNVLMYLLFFASNGNEKARTLALRLANHVLKE